MAEKVKVILITDGDKVAQQTVEDIAASLGLRCISGSAGNPTPIDGEEIVRLLQQVPHDPVLVMFDDRGRCDAGRGETALRYVAAHPAVEVLGAVAVASNTTGIEGVAVDKCITADGKIVNTAVDKLGESTGRDKRAKPVVLGDTVDVLSEVKAPIIVGIGDVGKMDHADSIDYGSPITRKAIEEILQYHGIEYPKIKR